MLSFVSRSLGLIGRTKASRNTKGARPPDPFCGDCSSKRSLTCLDDVIEESGVKSFGPGVAGELGLLFVEQQVEALRDGPPLAVEGPRGQLALQVRPINAKQVRGEVQL